MDQLLDDLGGGYVVKGCSAVTTGGLDNEVAVSHEPFEERSREMRISYPIERYL